MAQATTTTLGEIILAGDLAGSDANNPTLRPSGVDAGQYSPVMGVHVDSKGRITWAGIPDYDEEIAPYLPSASTSTEGLCVVGRRISVSGGTISVPDASTSTVGVVAIGSGLQINGSGQVVPIVPEGDEATKGIVQIGSNINVTAGVISRAGWEDATTGSKGMIMIGTGIPGPGDDGLYFSSAGVLAAIPATDTYMGLVRPATGITGELYWETGTEKLHVPAASSSLYGLIFGYTGSYLNIDGSGELTCTIPVATTSTLGTVKIGANLYITGDGELSLYPYASTSVKGLVQIGTNIDVASGVISIPDATTSVKGVVRTGYGLDISSGIVSLTTISDGSTLGRVQIGTNIDVASGVISIKTGTTSDKGVISFNGDYFTTNTASEYGQTWTGLRFQRAHDSLANFGVVKSANTDNITITTGSMDVGSNIPKLNTVNEFTGAQVVTPVTGTYAASYTPEFASSNCIDLTLTGNITINNPVSIDYINGGKYTIILKQDATGGRTLTLGSNFKTNETITLSTAANAIDVLNIIAKSSTELFVIFNKGYA